MTDKKIKAIEENVEKEIEEAVAFAQASPSPSAEDALKNVFAGEGGPS